MNKIFPKDFDGWIEKKKDCHYREPVPPMFKERDIWWVSKVKDGVVKMISFSPQKRGRG